MASQLRAATGPMFTWQNNDEWAGHVRSKWAGYSTRGGLTLNPYGPGELFVGGSSSGSAVATAAHFAAAAIGTKTSGSIISPASQNGVVGIKPTLGLVSRTGIIPIAHSQDTAGPMARSVRDAAIVLGALTGLDERDAGDITSNVHSIQDYMTFLDNNGLAQARIGIPRFYYEHLDQARIEIVEAAIAV